MQDRRRIVGLMFLLTVAGLVLLVPPVVYIFNHNGSILGVPQIVVYLFSVWTALIVSTAALTRHLGRDRPIDGDGGEG